MTEFWVSQQRFWCKYCAVWIADNKEQRTQHENGLKHKGNKERFLRNVEKRERHSQIEEAKTKKMLERIDQEAQSQFESDLARHKALNPDPPATSDPVKPLLSRRPPPQQQHTTTAKSKYDIKYDLSQYGIGTSAPTLEELQGIPPPSFGQYQPGANPDDHPPPPADPLGPWVAVDPPKPSASGSGGKAGTEAAQYGLAADLMAAERDEEAEEDLRHFKVKEKVLSADGDEDAGVLPGEVKQEGVGFKKRNLAVGGGRNVRRRKD
ncbi:hypothetical protein M427DRAFT_56354 [Gonapodya prolifera JEL478]|uniref:Matrin-type domain-containing protein n=1 Tax=Gonapodya prolifera (strain JEL478) TaxID=1344416 RepID=A0A139AGA5_GONPJ|nr:hypothetical protein M427DRAFT_56354 [Gonapodya prolifera JEL478]|eukprot:KXS15788.1 hypothetical protein M427DRAFT_56354 [Gonapodya prolifera JEL478]